MKQQRHLGIATATREATQARALIADILRLIEVLNVDIAFREQEAGVTDLARPDYPVLEPAAKICWNDFRPRAEGSPF